MNQPLTRHDLKGNKSPIDPDVRIPEAVRRNAERAEAAQRASVGAPEPAPAPSDTLNIIEPPALPGEPVYITPASNEPPAPTQPAPRQDGLPADADQSAEAWKRRYEAQLGRVRVLTGQNTQLVARTQSLEEMLANLPSERAAPAPFSGNNEFDNLVTDKERDEYGPEMIDLIGRRAQEIAGKFLAPIQNELAALRGQVQSTTTSVAKTSKEKMMERLDGEVPGWREVNMLPEFTSWLALPDPYFGVMRQSRLTEVWNACDTPSVLAFFKGFASEQAALNPAPLADTAPAPQPARPSLASLAAPGRARSSAPPAPEEKPIITKAQITAFYSDVRRGTYKGRETEQAENEAIIFSAQRDGRVR